EHVLSPARPAGREGVGLTNIRRRLKYTFNTDLMFTSRPGGGTKVTLQVPLDTAGDERAHQRA
ncbi:MAG: hypothetical protein K6T83_22300, partial [Alicyclobacillus sp.]|nr:hypothetical protein [Alicyclobacillus sp.]